MNYKDKYIIEAGMACVRISGYTNMFSKNDVQYAAFYLGFTHLVMELEQMPSNEYFEFLSSIDLNAIEVPDGEELRQIIDEKNDDLGREMVREYYPNELEWAYPSFLEIQDVSMLYLMAKGEDVSTRLNAKKIAAAYDMRELEEFLMSGNFEGYLVELKAKNVPKEIQEILEDDLPQKEATRNFLECMFESQIEFYKRIN